jgi:hypothetical protein
VIVEKKLNILRVPASRIGVEPAFIRGFEDRGMVFFTWTESPVVGGQCANCNTILWVYQRRDVILNENPPPEVPESGAGYRKYREQKIFRFLSALPVCPQCGKHCFDRFVNNVSYPRFAAGGEVPEELNGADVLRLDPDDVEVSVIE